jgi:hypothetical protein
MEKKPDKKLGKSVRSKGVMMTYMTFLLFSSLLIFTYMVAHIAVMENDIYAVTLSVARVRNQFDAVEYHFLRLPTTDLNYTINGSSIIFVEYLPFPVTNESSTGFIAFKKFVENYSLINTTFDAVHELPGELRIQPHRVSVIHPDPYSVVVLPLDNQSADAVVSYAVALEVDGSTPTVEWVKREEPKEGESAILLTVVANGTGEPQRISSVSGLVDKGEDSEILVRRGANEIMRIKLEGEDNAAKLVMELDKKFSTRITYVITFDSPITETLGGLKPANVTVTVPNVLKRTQIVK